jgi:hypothetical protein
VISGITFIDAQRKNQRIAWSTLWQLSVTGQADKFLPTVTIPDIDVSDHDYLGIEFGYVPDSFLSEPMRNQGNGTWAIYFAQIYGQSGRFLGLVLAV